MFKIVSHPRTGTHLLAKLLHLNFNTGHRGYRGLINSHFAPWPWHTSRIGVVRDCMATMQSLWRMRERFGVWGDVNFTMFVNTPWPELPRSESCRYYLDGGSVRTDANHQMCVYYWDTPVRTWAWVQKHVWRACNHTVQYDDLVSDQESVVKRVAAAVGISPRPEFKPVTTKVGIWGPAEEEVECSDSDAKMIQAAQDEFDRFAMERSREPPCSPEEYETVRRYRESRRPQKKQPKQARAPQQRPKKTRTSRTTSTSTGVVRQVSGGPARGDKQGKRKVVIKGKTIIRRKS